MYMNEELKTQEILEAVQTLSTHIDQQFEDIRAQMVTKAYLDEKLTDLRGDLVVLIRKEDHKLLELVTILKEKQVLNTEDVKRVLALEPFPSTSL